MTDLNQQIEALQSAHTGLNVVAATPTILRGLLGFRARHGENNWLEGLYSVEIHIPDDYPRTLPKVFELEDKIKPEFGHINPDKTLCLAVAVEARRIFLKEPTLLGFVNQLVVPYFYSYQRWEATGEFPFGQAAHGNPGIRQYYEDYLGCYDFTRLKSALYALVKKGYRGHYYCPCDSGKIVRKCHKEQTWALAQPGLRRTLISDLHMMFKENPVSPQNADV